MFRWDKLKKFLGLAHTIYRKLPEVIVTEATTSLTALQCSGTMINTYGAADNMSIELPAAAQGLACTIIASATLAKYLHLDPTDNDSIYLDGVTTGDGKYIGIADLEVGDGIQLTTVKTGASAYDWVAIVLKGDWALEE